MSEVSGRAWSFFEAVDRAGLAPLTELLDEVGLDRFAPRSPRTRISWDVVAALTDALAARITLQQLEDTGRLVLTADFLGGLFRVLDAFGDVQDVYRLGMTWIGPSMYRSLAFTYDDSGLDRIRISVRIKDGYRPCETFFHSLRGTLALVPELVGQEPAQVEADITPRHATFDVTLSHRALRRGPVRRALRTFSIPRAISRAMGEQQRQISAQIAQLQEAESGYAALLDALPAAVMLVENDRVLYANPALAQALGRDRHGLIGVHMDTLVHTDDVVRFNTTMHHGRPAEVLRIRMLRPDGSIVHLEGTTLTDVRFHGRVVVGLSAIDVTSRVDAEAQLEQSRDTLRAVIEVMPDVLVHLRSDGTILNVFGGRLLPANDLASLMACADVEALFGPDGFNSPQHIPVAFALLSDVLRTGETKIFEFQARHDDVLRTIEGRLIPMGNGDELIAFVRDITERRQQERQLSLSERMASVGTLAAGVAHEINSPLAFVTANLSLLRELLDRERTSLPPAFADAMSDMVRESSEGTRRVDSIVRSLGQYARPQPTEPGPIDVEPAVQAAISLTGRQIRQRATLELAFGHPRATIANSDRLTQVMVNLLVNAVQATPEGTPSAQTICVRTADENGKVVIEVSDTGHGIAPDALEQIFDPFFTTKPVGEGSGLGLFISHRMIREFGGSLSATSEPGRGTTMRIELLPAPARTVDLTTPGANTRSSDHDASTADIVPADLATVDLAALAPTIDLTPPEAAPLPSILVVDDEPLIGTMMTRALAAYDTVAETSGQAVIDRFERGERPDLVLCDLMLPGMTGMEIYERACRIDPVLRDRFLFMTGGAFTDSADAFARAHADDLLDKPIGLQQLRDAVRARLSQQHDKVIETTNR